MDGQTDRWTDRQTDGGKDGWTDGWTDGWMDKQNSPCVLQDFIPFGAATQKGANCQEPYGDLSIPADNFPLPHGKHNISKSAAKEADSMIKGSLHYLQFCGLQLYIFSRAKVNPSFRILLAQKSHLCCTGRQG